MSEEPKKEPVKEQEVQEQSGVKESKKIKKEKVGFFKKVYYSVTKIEKYPEMSAQGMGKAIGYISLLVGILAIIICIGITYKTHQMIQEGIVYLEKEFPEFSYNEGILNIEKDEPIKISEKDSVAGYTVIDTKVESEQEINQYINEIESVGDGILVLKDKLLLKNAAITGTITYNYKDIFSQVGINQFAKQDVINYAQSAQVISLYVSIFFTIFIYAFIMCLLTTVSNAVFLGVFGYLAAGIANVKMRFVAIFNMAVYSLSLSVILSMIYILINTFGRFYIEYFQVMYISVAAIYLIAAIFLLKSELIKRQAELMKIVEVQAEIKRNQEEEKEQEEKKENKETKKEENKDKKNKKGKNEEENLGEEPEGSNA